MKVPTCFVSAAPAGNENQLQQSAAPLSVEWAAGARHAEPNKEENGKTKHSGGANNVFE
jgi:hypothetical protein